MAKINLTHKSTEDQLRILKDYIQRRTQHKDQGPVELEQVIKRFKHRELNSDRKKYSYFKRLLRMATQPDYQNRQKPDERHPARTQRKSG